ncbi:MAG: DUF1211 domain-containing protein [Gemmatimonadaceae bacterium]|nr:DUF1211 domain-containing protein [Gemmatimonadaceae bacterium]
MKVPIRTEPARLEAFSDAMIAFAATLLVVSLEVPRTYDQLIGNLGGFIPFALSFAALTLIWAAHRSLFRRYPLDDNFTVVVNAVLMFTVLFYVYPLKFLSSAFVSTFTGQSAVVIQNTQQLASLFAIYAVGWMLVFSCIALLYRHAYSRRVELGLDTVEAYDAISHCRHYVVFVIVGALSLLLAIVGVKVKWGGPGLAFVMIAPLAWANGHFRERKRPVLEPAPEIIPSHSRGLKR